MLFTFWTCAAACTSSLPKRTGPACGVDPGMLASLRVASTFAVSSATSWKVCWYNTRVSLSTWAFTATYCAARSRRVCNNVCCHAFLSRSSRLCASPLKLFSGGFDGRPSNLGIFVSTLLRSRCLSPERTPFHM